MPKSVFFSPRSLIFSLLAAEGCAEASVLGTYLLIILLMAPPAGYQLPPVLAVAMDSKRLSAAIALDELTIKNDPAIKTDMTSSIKTFFDISSSS
jgi:hypothetical protein